MLILMRFPSWVCRRSNVENVRIALSWCLLVVHWKYFQVGLADLTKYPSG